MSKLFGKAFRRYQESASSISLLPNDDFEHKFSHSPYAIEEKAMKITAQQMREALSAYLVEHPEIIRELEESLIYLNDKQLQNEFDEFLKSAEQYVNKRQLKLAF
ncbi:hypothetical protein [Acinetobacter bereziniae]|uniref:hypothetical protein n=1 Tax=Acinetobacter bereziniae TaxID=106648 RepID=UPI002252DB4E|nr:hypothetical protein [Acinetobacter bereziniae]